MDLEAKGGPLRLPVWALVAIALAGSAAAFEADPDEGWEAEVPPEVLARGDGLLSKLPKLNLFGRSAASRGVRYYERIEKNSASVRDRARATLAQAELHFQAKDFWAAHECYKRALENYAGHVPFNDVLEREYDIATQHFQGRQGRVLFLRVSTNDKARQIYDLIVKAGPYAEAAPKALYQSGLLAVSDRDFDDAVDCFTRLISGYGDNPLAADARIDMAAALLLAAEDADGDGRRTLRGRRELQSFLARYPDHPRRPEAQEKMAAAAEIEGQRLLALAEFYLRPAHFREAAAREYLRQIVDELGATGAAKRAAELLATPPASGEPAAAPLPEPAASDGPGPAGGA